MDIIFKYKNLFVLIVIILFFAFIFNKVYNSYQIKSENIKNIKNIVDNKKIIAEKLLDIRNKKNIILEKFFKDPLEIKKYIEDKARESFLDIDSVKIDRRDEEFFLEITVNLLAKSSYKNFLNFLRKIEDKNIIIERLYLKKSDDPGKINEEILLKGYIVK